MHKIALGSYSCYGEKKMSERIYSIQKQYVSSLIVIGPEHLVDRLQRFLADQCGDTLNNRDIFLLAAEILCEPNHIFYAGKTPEFILTAKGVLADILDAILDLDENSERYKTGCDKSTHIANIIQVLKVLYDSDMYTEDSFIALISHNNSDKVAEVIIRMISYANRDDRSKISQSNLDVLLGTGEPPDEIASCIRILDADVEGIERILLHNKPKGLAGALRSLEAARLLTPLNIDLLFSSDYEYLFTPNDSYVWEKVSYDLLNQQILNEFFALAKLRDREKLNEYVSSIASYGKKRQQLVFNINKKLDNEAHKWEVYGKLIGMPRYFVSRTLKEIFSYGLGFFWAYNLLNELNLPHLDVKLPTLKVTGPYANDGDVCIPCGGNYSYAHAGHMVAASNKYALTPLNLIFVIINYIARNLGKLLGAMILLPWTVPVTLINRGVHAIRSKVHSKRIKRSINECCQANNQPGLIRDWLDGKISVDPYYILKNSSDDDIRIGFEKFVFSRAEEEREKRYPKFNLFNCYVKNRINALKSSEKKRMQKSKIAGVVAIVISAIVLSPVSLFVSVPLFIRNLQKNKMIEASLTERNENIILLESEFSAYVNNEKSAYEIGMEYLENCSQYGAYFFLSKVLSSDANYSHAMFECGNIAFSNGLHQEAANFFSKAGEINLQNAAARAARGETVTVASVSASNTRAQNRSDSRRSYHATSPAMFVVPDGDHHSRVDESKPLLGYASSCS